MTDSTHVNRELIAGLDERRVAARAFVSTLSPDLPVHDDSDWTARDLVIHLTALETDMVRAMQCALAGEAFAVDLRGEEDAPALYELRRRDVVDRSWKDLLREWERAREQLRGVVLAFRPSGRRRAFRLHFLRIIIWSRRSAHAKRTSSCT